MSMPVDKNYFQIYKGDCDVFVETGTYLMEGTKLSVLAGFNEIHTIDIIDYHVSFNNINKHIGDSAEVLKVLLPTLKDRKIMFWLDAHSQMMEGEEDNYPLMRELEVIGGYIKSCVILIDDYLYMTHPKITGFSDAQIRTEIFDINPVAEITYLSNPIKNNILLARL